MPEFGVEHSHVGLFAAEKDRNFSFLPKGDGGPSRSILSERWGPEQAEGTVGCQNQSSGRGYGPYPGRSWEVGLAGRTERAGGKGRRWDPA